MAEIDRRGIGRLDWLQENDPHAAVGQSTYPPVDVPRFLMMSDHEINIQIARALIEELHDFLLELRHPAMVITNPP